MAEFTLDTSGEVRGKRLIETPEGDWRSHWTWGDISALPYGQFAQGYVEALIEDFTRATVTVEGRYYIGFRHLAAETIVAILKDCATFCSTDRGVYSENHALSGRAFWAMRQSVAGLPGFPPLTATLGDGSKVYVRERLDQEVAG